jgi:hypothetical protein
MVFHSTELCSILAQGGKKMNEEELLEEMDFDVVIRMPPKCSYELICMKPETKAAMDNEITALRELITCMRESFVVTQCKCDEMKHGMTCNRCFYIHMIDKGLAGLAEVRR